MIYRICVRIVSAIFLLAVVASCAREEAPAPVAPSSTVVEPRPEIYADFELTADLGSLSDNQREMIAVLIDASEIMDELFWRQAYGDDHIAWLQSIEDADTRRFAELMVEVRRVAQAVERTT